MSPLAEQAFAGGVSKLAIVAVTVVATAALVATLALILGRRQTRIERRIAGYEAPDAAGAPVAAIGPGTTFVRTGVDLAERIARQSGLHGRTEALLDQADVPIRAGELLFYVPTFALLAFLLGSLVGDVTVGLVLAAAVALVPIAYLSWRRRGRLRRFEMMLPSMLALLAGSLRAGFSLLQGLETIAQEAGEPARRELQRVFTEVRLGQAPEDALASVAVRMKSPDLAWAVMAIRIQREVGGNLAALLDTVADTMNKRERLRREVRALTAEGRLSAVVLSLFPPIAAVMLWLLEPDYIGRLFDEGIGIVAVVAAVLLSVVGWFWLRRIVDIEE